MEAASQQHSHCQNLLFLLDSGWIDRGPGRVCYLRLHHSMEQSPIYSLGFVAELIMISQIHPFVAISTDNSRPIRDGNIRAATRCTYECLAKHAITAIAMSPSDDFSGREISTAVSSTKIVRQIKVWQRRNAWAHLFNLKPRRLDSWPFAVPVIESTKLELRDYFPRGQALIADSGLLPHATSWRSARGRCGCTASESHSCTTSFHAFHLAQATMVLL